MTLGPVHHGRLGCETVGHTASSVRKQGSRSPLYSAHGMALPPSRLKSFQTWPLRHTEVSMVILNPLRWLICFNLLLLSAIILVLGSGRQQREPRIAGQDWTELPPLYRLVSSE